MVCKFNIEVLKLPHFLCIFPSTLLPNLGGSSHRPLIDIMSIIHVAPYVYAVRINVKVHNATLAVTMKCNYILAVFEVGCLCTLAHIAVGEISSARDWSLQSPLCPYLLSNVWHLRHDLLPLLLLSYMSYVLLC